jgi:hypothetical protein
LCPRTPSPAPPVGRAPPPLLLPAGAPPPSAAAGLLPPPAPAAPNSSRTRDCTSSCKITGRINQFNKVCGPYTRWEPHRQTCSSLARAQQWRPALVALFRAVCPGRQAPACRGRPCSRRPRRSPAQTLRGGAAGPGAPPRTWNFCSCRGRSVAALLASPRAEAASSPSRVLRTVAKALP